MFSDDMCQIDAGMADQQFHTNPPILQANETCEIGKPIKIINIVLQFHQTYKEPVWLRNF